jgi:hypothetical protein
MANASQSCVLRAVPRHGCYVSEVRISALRDGEGGRGYQAGLFCRAAEGGIEGNQGFGCEWKIVS